jgi:hypothetical protein
VSLDGGAEFRHHCPGLDARVVVPLEALADCEGKDDSPVMIDRLSDTKTELRWTQNGVPQVRTYDAPEVKIAFPEPPDSWTTNSLGLLDALDDALATVAQDSTRYALDHVQLKGLSGEVIASDSKQLLIQSGFEFPWKDNVLVSRVGLSAVKALTRVEAVHLGRSEGFIWIRTGAWSLVLPIDLNGRYPDVQTIIPSIKADTTRLVFDPTDADMLVTVLPDLPGVDEPFRPVTVDLNGSIAIRAKGAAQAQATELVLKRSRVTGPGLRLVLDRTHLNRARKLGFDAISIVAPTRPVVCRNGAKTFVAMPLDEKLAIAPSEDVLRVGDSAAAVPMPKTTKQSAAPLVTSGRSIPSAAQKTPAPARGLIEESIAIQNDLRNLLGRVRGQSALVRKERRQHKLLKSTLDSLKQLQRVAA